MVQTVLYDLFKRVLGSGPVYAALGNHDSYNQCVSSLTHARVLDTHPIYAGFVRPGPKTRRTRSIRRSPNSSAGTFFSALRANRIQDQTPYLAYADR